MHCATQDGWLANVLLLFRLFLHFSDGVVWSTNIVNLDKSCFLSSLFSSSFGLFSQIRFHCQVHTDCYLKETGLYINIYMCFTPITLLCFESTEGPVRLCDTDYWVWTGWLILQRIVSTPLQKVTRLFYTADSMPSSCHVSVLVWVTSLGYWKLDNWHQFWNWEVLTSESLQAHSMWHCLNKA